MSTEIRGRLARAGVALAACLAAAGCSSMKVSRQFDPDLMPAALESFALAPEHVPLAGDLADFEARFRDEIEAGLAELGIESVPVGQSTVLLDFRASVASKIVNRDPYFHFHSAAQVETGTLSIELLDPKTRRTIWKGSNTTELRTTAVPDSAFVNDFTSIDRPRRWEVDRVVGAILERLERDL